MTKNQLLNERFAQTFVRLIDFVLLRSDLVLGLWGDNQSEAITPQLRETLMLGQRGATNLHVQLAHKMGDIKRHSEQNGWNGLTESERALITKTADLAEVYDFRDFAERSRAIALRYFEIEQRQ